VAAAAAGQRQMTEALKTAGLAHDDIREIEVRMEEAFISLVRRQAAEAREGRAP